MKTPRASLFLALALPFLNTAHADVTLPPLISDNMLLQRAHAAVWGKADPGEAVTVRLGKSVAQTTADAQGRWRVALDGLQPGAAGEMTITGKNTLTIQNVAVGDVWVCSGQSNMEMNVKAAWHPNGGVLNFEQEIAAAQFPGLRMFTVPKVGSEVPLEDVAGKWEICTPETVYKWSATGYFFGRQLHQDLHLPIGLIHSSWGGTYAQAWTPREVLQADPEFNTIYLDPKPLARRAEYLALKEKYEKEQIPAWLAAVKGAEAEGKPQPARPLPPKNPNPGGISCTLYNAMIAGATKYPITGAIWYQGEANAGDAVRYRRLLPAMIDAWRKAWGQEFPFYIVQLANYRARTPEPVDSNWANLREAQRLTAQNHPHCGLAVAIDIGEADNIHPKNKQEVGCRLALMAEAKTYGKQIVYSGPDPAAVKFDGARVLVEFKPATALGLATTDGSPVKSFAVAGEDQKFHWAEARILAAPQQPEVALSCPEVSKPVAVRYAWANNPDVNLVNGAGLPALPFRTDDWPQVEPPAPAASAALAPISK